MNWFNFALIIQLFTIINPLSSFPVLLAAHKNKINVKKIAINAILVAFVIAIVIALVGTYLFSIFNISIDSFRIAGGIVLMLLGLGKISSKANDRKEIKETDALISIIATPLLTGPALISFIILRSFEFGRVSLISNLLFAFILVGIVFTIFAFSVKKINPKIISVLSRILGLFLVAVAIEMLAKGIHGLFPI